jgi:hypothetical protein
MSLAWDQDTAVALPHGGLIAGITHLVGSLLDRSEDRPFEYAQILLCVQGTNSDQIAQVRQWAAVMNVDAVWEPGMVWATGQLGPLTVQVYTNLKIEPELQVTLAQSPAVDDDQEPTVTQPAVVDETAMPEIACGACLGTGQGRDGGSCIYCLGKGSVLAWQPDHAIGAQAS